MDVSVTLLPALPLARQYGKRAATGKERIPNRARAHHLGSAMISSSFAQRRRCQQQDAALEQLEPVRDESTSEESGATA